VTWEKAKGTLEKDSVVHPSSCLVVASTLPDLYLSKSCQHSSCAEVRFQICSSAACRSKTPCVDSLTSLASSFPPLTGNILSLEIARMDCWPHPMDPKNISRE
jgi:hypothetical protein